MTDEIKTEREWRWTSLWCSLLLGGSWIYLVGCSSLYQSRLWFAFIIPLCVYNLCYAWRSEMHTVLVDNALIIWVDILYIMEMIDWNDWFFAGDTYTFFRRHTLEAIVLWIGCILTIRVVFCRFRAYKAMLLTLFPFMFAMVVGIFCVCSYLCGT